jgi:misacylated tRNA(Ala) deacylase
MAVYLCHEFPDLSEHEAQVVDATPGRVLLDRSALHPGGGGQVSDTGWIEFGGGVVPIVGVDPVSSDDVPAGGEREQFWHVLADESLELSGPVHVRVDAERRSRVAQLHTDSHILNALVYERFPGTLVTGAQINADGTGRMDFDLSEVDNDVLRGLDTEINAIIGRGVDVRSVYVDASQADAVAGLVRSLSVAPPPTPDGTLRIIEIDGVDRQACGGTHLSNTGQSGPVRITKVENKGKRNRRIRFELA